MGVHSGSVSGVVDVTGRANVAGAGINIAQRVMDCADGGHILLSKHAADDLAEYERWRPLLHDLGPCEVKHGVKVHVVSLWSADIGNSRLPSRLKSQRQRASRKRWMLLGAAAALLALTASGALIWRARETARAAGFSRSVAVLPFESLSTNPENAIFAGGVHREVLTNLAKVAALKVISRTSVMRYQPGTERNLKDIAQELGVAYVVEGSVQREADHILVTAELIEAATDSHVWAQRYDGKTADVLTFQSEIAERISNQLGAKLSSRERTELASKPTQDLAAYESYVRAQALMETPAVVGEYEKSIDDNKRAIQILEQAVARDPRFAAAYCAIAEANLTLLISAVGPNADYKARAEAALKEAQRLAPDAGETLLTQARFVYYGDRDYRKALDILEQAAKSLPNNAEVTVTRALLYRRFGRWQEAYAQFVRTTELDPENFWGYINAGGAAEALRWWDELDQWRGRVVKHFPRRVRPAGIAYAESLRLRGDIAAADKELESRKPEMDPYFGDIFEQAMWKRDYSEARRLVNEAAKYPQLELQRWQKEMQLFFVTNEPAPSEAAEDAEKRFEEQLKKMSSDPDEIELIDALIAVKLILGKKEEAVRLAQASLERNPIEQDAITNAPRLKSLAYAYWYAGDREHAMQTFAKSAQIPNVVWYGPLKFDPVLDELRKDPRFEAIVEQSKAPFPR